MYTLKMLLWAALNHPEFRDVRVFSPVEFGWSFAPAAGGYALWIEIHFGWPCLSIPYAISYGYRRYLSGLDPNLPDDIPF